MKLTDNELMEELRRRFDENAKTLSSMKVLNERLVEVNRKLQDSESLKSNFLSNIRNEINNPLTSILCIAEALIHVDEIEKEAIPDMARSIYSEAFNLDFQLRNIFAAAELEAGETQNSASLIDAASFVKSTVDLFAHRAAARKIKVEYDLSGLGELGESFAVDPEKLQLAFSNIMSNAIEYSHDEGVVEIKAWTQEGCLKLSVKDYGVGIDESELKTVFDRFRQLDTGVTKSHLGHGLGAAVTKAVIELIDGTITVASEKGKGSEFIITVPESSQELNAEMFSGEGNEFFFEAEEQEF